MGVSWRGVTMTSLRPLITTSLCALLVACDPGYGFTVQSRCDMPVRVEFFDSNEFDRATPSQV
jgi:hypothetical protein